LEDTDINPGSYTSLSIERKRRRRRREERGGGAKNVQWRTDRLFNNCCWENWISACKKLNLDPSFTLYKYQLKWIKEHNIRRETLKLVQEKAGNTLEIIGIYRDFFNRTQKEQQLRERIDKWEYMKLKRFCKTKEMFFKLKRLDIDWEKSLPAIHLTRN
jgi:hypothetical protein